MYMPRGTVFVFIHLLVRMLYFYGSIYEGWNFNSGNYLFTTDTK